MYPHRTEGEDELDGGAGRHRGAVRTQQEVIDDGDVDESRRSTMSTAHRELRRIDAARDEVVLVDLAGNPRGVAEKALAHSGVGMLHAAVSVALVNRDNQLLIQRRSGTKQSFGSWWSNSCCTHPTQGERPLAAIERRILEELGMGVSGIRQVGAFVYAARDHATDVVEYERDTVFIGVAHEDPDPDEQEIDDWAWISPADSISMQLTPWATTVHRLALEALAP